MSLIEDFDRALQECYKATQHYPREWIIHQAVYEALCNEVRQACSLKDRIDHNGEDTLMGIPVRQSDRIIPLAAYRTHGGDTHVVHLSVPVAFR